MFQKSQTGPWWSLFLQKSISFVDITIYKKYIYAAKCQLSRLVTSDRIRTLVIKNKCVVQASFLFVPQRLSQCQALVNQAVPKVTMH
jgi:hypothetical protein